MDAWMHGCKDGCMDGYMDAWMHPWVNARMPRCMDAWMPRCMDAWRDMAIQATHAYTSYMCYTILGGGGEGKGGRR